MESSINATLFYLVFHTHISVAQLYLISLDILNIHVSVNGHAVVLAYTHVEMHKPHNEVTESCALNARKHLVSCSGMAAPHQ